MISYYYYKVTQCGITFLIYKGCALSFKPLLGTFKRIANMTAYDDDENDEDDEDARG